MQKINRLYRSEYIGEEIVVESTYKRSHWEYDREFVPSGVENQQITNHACVLGNGYSRAEFELHLLANHKGGLGGRKTLQSYGCNALHRNFAPHFLVVNHDTICQEVIDSGYCNDHIVYANSQFILKYPGKFYLIPQDPHWNAGTIATYMACFDGHKKVYLVGFDNSAGENLNNNMYADTPGYAARDYNYSDRYWITSMTMIMSLYDDVEFTRVMPTTSWHVPTEWSRLANFRQINYNRFILETDL